MGASKISSCSLISILIGTIFTNMAQLFFSLPSQNSMYHKIIYTVFAFDAIICVIFVSEINFHK